MRQDWHFPGQKGHIHLENWAQAKGTYVNQKQIECKHYANSHVVLLIASFSGRGALGKPLAWVTGNRMSRAPLPTHLLHSFLPQGPSSPSVTAATATISVVSIWNWLSYNPLLSMGWLCLPCQTGGSSRVSWGRDPEASLFEP